MDLDGTDMSNAEWIERYIDTHGLGALLGLIASVCDEKGTHVQHAWQDRVTANAWHVTARHLERVDIKV
jgi:hypothetical protein